MRYSVIIPAMPEHAETVKLSLDALRSSENGGHLDFLIITPAPMEYRGLLASDGVEIKWDADYEPISKESIAGLLPIEKQKKAGWYYQQILKYAAILKSEAEHVLVLDADTVILGDPCDFLDGFGSSKEMYIPYRAHYLRLFKRQMVLGESAIVNFMWFKPALLREMLAEVECMHKENWWKVILRAAHEDEGGASDFSEYETYANWVVARDGRVNLLPVDIFRRGDLLLTDGTTKRSIVESLRRKKYGAVAFELSHGASIVKKFFVRMFFMLNIKYW